MSVHETERDAFGRVLPARERSCRRGPLKHVVLLFFGLLFFLPIVWMASTSLKPLDQTMMLPPTWVPRATVAMLDGEKKIVVREKKIRGPSAIVIPQAGVEKGKRKLLTEAEIKPDGTALIRYTRAGREEYEDKPVAVTIEKKVPAGYWQVAEWIPEHEADYEQRHLLRKWDCLAENELDSEIHPFFSNYASTLVKMQGQGQERNAGWYESGFVLYLRNTLWICILGVIGTVASCTLVAYAFAFLEFRGRNLLFGITLAVMMVPFPATMVPSYDLFHKLGWIGTYKPLWVSAWFGGAFNIFLLRQFFLGLPRELIDAARIDGCGELEIIWHVIVPLSRPALAMVALFTFLNGWKDFMGPLLYLTDPSQFTLALGLQSLQSQQGGTPWHLAMAGAAMFSLPLIVLFLFARKTFMRGIAMTGIKG